MSYSVVKCSLRGCLRQYALNLTFGEHSVNWFCSQDHREAGLNWLKSKNISVHDYETGVWND